MNPRIAAAALACAATLACPPSVAAREVWHATRALMPGDMLRPDDARTIDLSPGRDRSDMLDAATPFVGLEVKRRIAAGMALIQRDVGARDLVHASQPVRVFWKLNGMTLELQGRAIESGPAGAEVRISNARNGRTIRAIVIAEGTAEIRSTPTDDAR